MDSRFYSTPTLQVYASLWNKYRPVVIQLMMGTEAGAQSYKLSAHEFRALNPKEKSYSFSLQAFQGKAVNAVKGSAVAQDLLSVLNASKKATELMDANTFEFTLNKNFILEVTRIS
ncbi:hypothetical protein [Pseudochryseolinea flava]|uniref:Uncharacterized protein n=1 Tax=Pseudochryseolinea flava TaxID=2059302 RepID=A0A364Y7H4_9BACT|nr:hypothetical protein [Pseudochryseolinea flava]RAW02927.1 hypothetical protein DQQ10_02135 [Pseudochryseolinea flava]